MSRIAFVEWWPRICGVTDVAVHLSAGVKPNGHEVDLISFSKSGKQLGAWGEKGKMWKAHRLADAVEVLNSYDLIFLADIICQAPQVNGGPKKEDRQEPYFVEIMRHVITPWTTILHGGYYAAKHDPTIEAMLETPSFTGVIMTPRGDDCARRFARFKKFTIVHDPYLAYDASSVTPYTGKRTREFLMTSRVTTTKGQSVALALLPELPGNVHVWGITAYGKPSPAWSEMWELGVALGYEQLQFPKIAKRINNRHPEAYKFYTGEFAMKAGKRKYFYHDAYDKLDEIDWAPWFSVSFTNTSLHNTLETSTLDAMAKGSIAIVPVNQFAFEKKPRYESLIGIPYEHATWKVKENQAVAVRDNWDRPGIITTLKEVCSYSDADLEEIKTMQRAELEKKHSPKRVFKHLLDSL